MSNKPIPTPEPGGVMQKRIDDPKFSDGTRDIGVAGLARLLQRKAGEEEASNGK